MEDKKRQKIGKWIGMAIGLVVGITVVQLVFKQPSFDRIMARSVEKLNKTCPVMVDEETRLDSINVLHENALQYNYTLVNMSRDSMDLKVFSDYMKPTLLNGVKTSPQLKIYRDHKTTFVYNYLDRNGESVELIYVTAEQYNDKDK
ncbi:MAG: hypothetical protein LKI59_06855 [Bacteroidales bacterium]|jgi:hypothetical protein|nr:hypothetical protein [Bacteroidales bacterium]